MSIITSAFFRSIRDTLFTSLKKSFLSIPLILSPLYIVSVHATVRGDVVTVGIHPYPTVVGVVGVVDNAVDNCREMAGQTYDESSFGEFVFLEMDFAPLTHQHSGNPFPTEKFHNLVLGGFVHAPSRTAHTALSLTAPFGLCEFVDEVVDFLVRSLRCDCDCSAHAVTRSSLETCLCATSVIEYPLHFAYLPFSFCTPIIPHLSRFVNGYNCKQFVNESFSVLVIAVVSHSEVDRSLSVLEIAEGVLVEVHILNTVVTPPVYLDVPLNDILTEPLENEVESMDNAVVTQFGDVFLKYNFHINFLSFSCQSSVDDDIIPHGFHFVKG